MAWLALALALGVGAFLLLDVARAAIYLTVGKAYANRGNLERAITVYSAALELEPRVGSREWLPIAYGYRGTAFLDKGEPAAAIDDLKQALVLNPEQQIYQERLMLGHVRRGESRLEGGELEGAIADLEAALRLAPQHPSAPPAPWPWPTPGAACNGRSGARVRGASTRPPWRTIPVPWRKRRPGRLTTGAAAAFSPWDVTPTPALTTSAPALC